MEVLMRLIGLTCALFLLVGAATAQTPEDALIQADREFAKRTAAHSLDGWMSVFTSKSVLFSENLVMGADAIRAAYQKLFNDPDFRLDWRPTKTEVFPSGNMGYTVGRYQGVFKNDKGEIVRQSGTYLTVWRKDQRWKLEGGGRRRRSGSGEEVETLLRTSRVAERLSC
jgi:ketosteroid isomerase-like protein